MIEQKLSFANQILFNIQYSHLVNEHNLENLTRFNLWKIFRHETPSLIDLYLHGVIKKWIANQNQQEVKFFSRLKHLLRKTKINLSQLEIHNLNLIEERIFSTYRHIKVLDVNYPLQTKEFVYARFNFSQLFNVYSRKLNLIGEGDLLITNRRFIILIEHKVYTFTFRKLKKLDFTNYGLFFTINLNQKFVLRVHDQITLSNTLICLIEKRVKWLSRLLKKENGQVSLVLKKEGL